MNILENIKSGIKNHFEKRKEQREYMERLQFEAKVQQQQIFEDQFKKDALEVAKARAMKDAARLSGMQKLRAENRLRNLNKNQDAPGTFFDKLRDYTQKNLARREENLKKTEMMRAKGAEIKEQRLQGPSTPVRKPFGGSTWKM